MILVIVIWAIVLGANPALVLIAVALTVLTLDRRDRRLLDRFLSLGIR